jgi:hypothetical protein
MKISRNSLIVAVLCGAWIVAAHPSRADAGSVYDISWTGPYGSGSVIANTTDEGSGEYLITSFASGTQNGLGITLLAPDTYPTVQDNYIFPGGNSPYGTDLDNGGFSFYDGQYEYNIFWAFGRGANNYYYECSSQDTSSCVGFVGEELSSFSITPAATPVPEPGALWLVATGALGLWRRRSFRRA